MHEMSIAEGILEIVERTARQNQVERVKKVRVAIGELAGVDIPSLEFAWVSVRRGGPADAAELEIERPKGEAWCLDCSKTVPLARYGDPCPYCGGYKLTATGGTEMRVLELIEEAPDEIPDKGSSDAEDNTTQTST